MNDEMKKVGIQRIGVKSIRKLKGLKSGNVTA
jgi:hypothetical protein